MSSLLAHEARVNRSYEKMGEKAFQVKGETSVDTGSDRTGNGCGRGGFWGKSRGRGQRRGCGKGGSNDERQNKVSFHCHYWTKPGHKEAYCWQKQKDLRKQRKIVSSLWLFVLKQRSLMIFCFWIVGVPIICLQADLHLGT